MADRRSDEAPLAPRRPLSGSTEPAAATDPGASPAGASRVSGARESARKAVARARSAATGGPQDGSTTTGGAAGRSGAPGSDGRSAQAGSATATTTRAPATGASGGSAAQRPRPRPRGTRRARLRLVHLDPWSVMKTALLLSIALGIVTVVAVAVVWSVLGAAGVWDSIDKTVADVLGGDSAQTFRVQDYVGTGRVLGFTMVVAALNVLLITAISTLAAFLYNLAAALLGGIEVTLAEDER